MYKLVVPSAGVGSRSGSPINKALVTIGNKPMIAHVLDRFPKAVEKIVLLGYQGDYVRQALDALYGPGNIKYVEVKAWDKGLGHSLYCAKEQLQYPFVFCPNDAVFSEDVEMDPFVDGNYMGYAWCDSVPDPTEYRTIEIVDGSYVGRINPKGLDRKHIYTGLCGVKDYKLFWSVMSDEAAVPAGEAHGLKALSHIRAVPTYTWRDGGSALTLQQLKLTHKTQYNILEKPGESIWFTRDHVVKFSTDRDFIRNRVLRTEYIDPDLIPDITFHDANVYSYRTEPGSTITKQLTPKMFTDLFELMADKMWSRLDKVGRDYTRFYRDKTYGRLRQFFAADQCLDVPETINGVRTTRVMDMLGQLPWGRFCATDNVALFHGDFHNENILFNPLTGRFKLLDWRQDFDGELRYGDVYYDLAKFYHGLLVSHESVRQGMFSVSVAANGDVSTYIERPQNLIDVEQAFKEWVAEHGFDTWKVHTITALIFLNIAVLHHYPYSLFLYFLGKKLLAESIANVSLE